MNHLQIRPFKAVHPTASDAPKVASVPYDVVNREEATKIAMENTDSFMRVVRSEVNFPEDVSPYDPCVYKEAKNNYDSLRKSGALTKDKEPSLYLYRQCMGDRHQVGIVACCHVDDYNSDIIRKHEKTRKVKEDDRTNHVLGIHANSGPVFLTYRGHESIDAIIDEEMNKRPMFHFVAEDDVTHTGWRVERENELLQACSAIDLAYVADGHHRSASAARSAGELARDNPHHNGTEEYNWFLAVLFSSSQLHILPYNRVVLDLNGKTPEQILDSLKDSGSLIKTQTPCPQNAGSCCIYLGNSFGWYQLDFNNINSNDPIASLDVDLLQQRVLTPLLGIGDPRSDTRIDFVGGIRGTEELERRVDEGDAAIAFSMYATTIEQLLTVADANLIMPPKSTWFEPKLRSGLFVHELD
ncbi:MAG: DUF1015 domain-containing protein [Phycisphaerales bacterium]|nr:DUF1015 domain-containing protein [Planctomycetota bacterium]MBL6998059.1 DUF1015 domain-containing protein [Phycisphaerales bacterium]